MPLPESCGCGSSKAEPGMPRGHHNTQLCEQHNLAPRMCPGSGHGGRMTRQTDTLIQTVKACNSVKSAQVQDLDHKLHGQNTEVRTAVPWACERLGKSRMAAITGFSTIRKPGAGAAKTRRRPGPQCCFSHGSSTRASARGHPCRRSERKLACNAPRSCRTSSGTTSPHIRQDAPCR